MKSLLLVFLRKLKLFSTQEEFFAETCLFQLKVPVVHEVLKDFKAAFMEACSNNKGFGSP